MPVDPTKTDSTHAASKPRNSLRTPEQEIRFAVVMYGGISLCIYIHGVAQELLRLVRATSGADVSDDEVAQIYRELSGQVRDQVPSPEYPDRRCQTRFVIDLLSGTSAGGINAVFLAKALALRSKDLKKLRDTWLDTADMDTILNRGGLSEPKRSLLNGNLMYEKLYEAFSGMNKGPFDGEVGYVPVEQLDLFVTNTDLNGVSIPIRLADMDVPEKAHKGCFNFRWDNVKLAKGPSADPLDTELDSLRHWDFEPQLDAMLAFAARCTSSFPIAFAPMKLAEIKPVIGKVAYDENKQKYCEFFRWIPFPPLIQPQDPLAIDERELADGGYLDNKPFDYVVDALSFRATTLPHKRKLFFVDPFPEIAGDAKDQPHFDFLENAIAGSITLPHYQTIRQEIDRVKVANGVQARLRALQSETMSKRPPTAKFTVTTVDKLIAGYGAVYDTYHVVRRLDCTDDLARTLSGLPASLLSEDSFLAVRYLVRAWRESTYAPNREPRMALETQFFNDFDFSFRMRRAAHLLEWAQQHRKGLELCELLINHLTRLHRRREQLSLPSDKNPIWPTILALGEVVTWESCLSILEPTDEMEREARALCLYEKHPAAFQEVAEAVKRSWAQVFDLNRKELARARKGDPDLDSEYELFDYRDMVSLAFLEGSNVSEHTETEIYRISPADGIQRPLEKKLAGYKVQAFGAFLKREWRQNDILWGRLDTCERIVSAILDHKADEALRNCFVMRLQDAIVKQEANLRSTQDLAPALKAIQEHRLREYLEDQYALPEGPARTDSARQIANSADIFGRMIEEDVGQKSRMTTWLRSIGGIGAQLIGLLTPGGLGRIFWNYWLALFGLMAALLWAFGSAFRDNHASALGAYGLGAALLIWFVSWMFADWLARAGVPRWIFVVRVLKWLPGIALLVLLVIGLLHVPEEALNFWQAILTFWHSILRLVGAR